MSNLNNVGNVEVKAVTAVDVAFTYKGEQYEILLVNGESEKMFWKGKEVPDHNMHHHAEAILIARGLTERYPVTDSKTGELLVLNGLEHAEALEEALIAAAESGADREYDFDCEEWCDVWIGHNYQRFLIEELNNE